MHNPIQRSHLDGIDSKTSREENVDNFFFGLTYQHPVDTKLDWARLYIDPILTSDDDKDKYREALDQFDMLPSYGELQAQLEKAQNENASLRAKEQDLRRALEDASLRAKEQEQWKASRMDNTREIDMLHRLTTVEQKIDHWAQNVDSKFLQIVQGLEHNKKAIAFVQQQSSTLLEQVQLLSKQASHQSPAPVLNQPAPTDPRRNEEFRLKRDEWDLRATGQTPLPSAIAPKTGRSTHQGQGEFDPITRAVFGQRYSPVTPAPEATSSSRADPRHYTAAGGNPVWPSSSPEPQYKKPRT